MHLKTNYQDTAKHGCKGKNDCKGQGGCKSSDNGCKGKNSCKGKGGCATDGSKPTWRNAFPREGCRMESGPRELLSRSTVFPLPHGRVCP